MNGFRGSASVLTEMPWDRTLELLQELNLHGPFAHLAVNNRSERRRVRRSLKHFARHRLLKWDNIRVVVDDGIDPDLIELRKDE
jgi:hypothetical protein